MNNIEKLYEPKMSMAEFAVGYFKYLNKILVEIDARSLNQLESELENSRQENATIFVAGNGGSAATSTTMANDIGFDIIKKTGVEKPFKFFSLTDNTSVITAIANDIGYENLFVGQLSIHFKAGDRLLVISASGNSPNVVKAVEWVKSRGGRAIGFLGFDGGKLKDLCDVVIQVPSLKGEYGPVEDAHLIINHILAHWFQCKLK